MKSTKGKNNFELVWTNEEIVINISLREKMAEFGVEFPEFKINNTASDIYEYFLSIEQAIHPSKTGMEKWNIRNGVYLDFFSFSKFIMYRDLNPGIWSKENLP